MKHQALFSLKDESKKIKCCLLQFLFGALRVKMDYCISLAVRQSVFFLPKPSQNLDSFLRWIYEGISKSFEPNMERARNLDLFCFIFQRSPLPTPHTCPI